MNLKITKFVHSCLLVETSDRTAVFDPGAMSENAFNFDAVTTLHDIFVTHIHGDHLSVSFIKKLIEKYPDAAITTTAEIVESLKQDGIKASNQPSDGVVFFDSPHEDVRPLFPIPQQIGIHYLNTLTDPGDSHNFSETKAILALPITAPWGSTIKALNLALQLKPKHVLPIHDWHWNEVAREQTYDNFERILDEQGITFHKLKTGEPVQIEIE
ncbi:MAG TPA: MBL fold metallo-hydrolase [Candidatus Saccharimonadales bacterium]|nr:MBL fold metallo-hydrolase [Candidatus Saccharimonadales bacterium]